MKKQEKYNPLQLRRENAMLLIFLMLLSIGYLILGDKLQAANLSILEGPANSTIAAQTTYKDISNMSYEMTIEQIKIGNNSTFDLNIESQILHTISQSEDLVKRDIIEAIKNSPNDENIVNDYLENSKKTIGEGTFFLLLLDQEIENKTREMESCTNEKKVSDDAYFKSITYYDQQGMIEALNTSAGYNTCIATARLEINAKNAIITKLRMYHDLLQTKYNFLSENQETLIKNINVMDSKILQELNNINETLKQYNS